MIVCFASVPLQLGLGGRARRRAQCRARRLVGVLKTRDWNLGSGSEMGFDLSSENFFENSGRSCMRFELQHLRCRDPPHGFWPVG